MIEIVVQYDMIMHYTVYKKDWPQFHMIKLKNIRTVNSFLSLFTLQPTHPIKNSHEER